MSTADSIRHLIGENGPLSSADLAAALGCTDRHVRRVIADMPDISPVRHGRAVRYTTTLSALHERAVPPADRGTGRIWRVFQAKNSGHDPGPKGGHSGHRTGPAPPRGPLPPPSVDRRGGGYGEPPAAGACASSSPDPRSGRAPPEGSAVCTGCPLALGDVEHDQVQFVLVDRLFHDLVLRTAAARSWSVREVRGTAWITPGPALTLQVGEVGDAVTFYSADPDGADIPGWLVEHFGDLHPEASVLAAAVRRPAQLTRDELTVIVTDEETKAAVRAVLKGQFAGDGTYRRPAPNAATPGLKIYEREGTMRIETDARNQYQANTALAVRQEVLTVLADLRDRPGLFADWLTRWWGPDTRPVLIDTNDLAARIAADLRENPRPVIAATPESAEPSGGSALAALFDEVAALEGWEIERVVGSLCRHLRLERLAALCFLAAFGCWSARRFRAPVYYEDLLRYLRDEDPPPDLAAVRAACDALRERGILEYDRRLDIRFSRTGTRLGKKLVAKWEG
ncbi:hypothetical protein [Methanofollis fontis]|uniref:Uncharacterized protein n=1 Tax=Methanofollis fontis TaxID=2052832 RepID=A0A483CM47_9EURY|nr:hypothetical protein [Methanofollis fontis]TAJ43631.1 hypothetical protein CUJ86_09805 [Methanofollis fontis]